MKKICVSAVLMVCAILVSIPIRAYDTFKTLTNGQILTVKWKSFPVTWQLNPSQGSNVTGSRTQAEIIVQSFQAWQSASTASVSLTQGADVDKSLGVKIDGFNVITTVPGNSALQTLPTGVLAKTFVSFLDNGTITEADMFFNPTEQFSTNATGIGNNADLQSVATHEAGHFLGMDHATNMSSTMFWVVDRGFTYPRTLSADDIAGISTVYPAASFAAKGKISGTVRTTANAGVFGAIVVAVNASGVPVASVITDPSGAYTIEGLDAGAYTVYAEPLSGRTGVENQGNINPGPANIYPDNVVNTSFTTRYR